MLNNANRERQSLIDNEIFSGLLIPLFSQLNQMMSNKYCVIGNYDDLPHYTTNDVDIWVSNEREFLRILKGVCRLSGYKIYLINHGYNGFNIYIVKIGFEMHLPVHLDIMTDVYLTPFYRIIDAKIIRSNIKKYNNFNVLSKDVELFGHLMYPLINKGVVRDKYKSQLVDSSENDTFKSLLKESIGARYSTSIISLISKREWSKVSEMSTIIRRKLLLTTLVKDNYRVPMRVIRMLTRLLIRLKKPSGLFIVFLGVDGSGKTTTIKSLDSFFDNYFLPGKCKKFYWRPFLLPRIAKLFGKKDNLVSEQYNEDGTRDVKKNLPTSILNILKLFYYVTDFIIGRSKYQNQYSRGGSVVFDRYYYDNIIYSQRFGFYTSKTLMKLLSCFVPKPDLIFYLNSNSTVLYERKRELNIEQLVEQQNRYNTMLFNFNNVVYVDTSNSLSDTHDSIVKSCILYMSDRISD
jgi:thymidylate kinase